jgi:nucleoid DNA-binding protein
VKKGRKSTTDLAVRVRDYKVPYQFKKISIRPILMALGDAIVDLGEVAITGLGRFYVHRKRVNKAVGSGEKVLRYAVAFKPYPSFLRRVEDRWSRPMEVKIETSPGTDIESPLQEASNQEPVSSADGRESSGSSVGGEGAQAASSMTLDTNW